jgi:flagellar FliJ protein
MFRFRLQRVLELRAEHEQAKARELASAQDAADAAKRAQDAIASLRASSRAEIDVAQGEQPRVGHLHQLGLVLQSIDARLERAGETVQSAETVVQEAQDALADAARDRRILDRLKDRHAEQWRAEEAARDRVSMDEVALARFGRKRDVESRDNESRHHESGS